MMNGAQHMQLPVAGPEWGRARRRANLSQAALAARVGITKRTIANLEGPGNRDVTPAIRRVVALELWIALGWVDPFTPTAEEVSQ
jgi:DNA-binding XRE family transcriptional regulator